MNSVLLKHVPCKCVPRRICPHLYVSFRSCLLLITIFKMYLFILFVDGPNACFEGAPRPLGQTKAQTENTHFTRKYYIPLTRSRQPCFVCVECPETWTALKIQSTDNSHLKQVTKQFYCTYKLYCNYSIVGMLILMFFTDGVVMHVTT